MKGKCHLSSYERNGRQEIELWKDERKGNLVMNWIEGGNLVMKGKDQSYLVMKGKKFCFRKENAWKLELWKCLYCTSLGEG